MKPQDITAETSMIEFAAIVSEALESAGITATLSGGGAVSAYTDNRYQSSDLDFVTTALLAELKEVREPLGFVHTGTPRLSVFEHPAVSWYLEFPPAPLGFGGMYVDASQCSVLATPAGAIRIISPTHCVIDRLNAATAWQDAQSLNQAILVARHQADQIDWLEIDNWILSEGLTYAREVATRNRTCHRPIPAP